MLCACGPAGHNGAGAAGQGGTHFRVCVCVRARVPRQVKAALQRRKSPHSPIPAPWPYRSSPPSALEAGGEGPGGRAAGAAALVLPGLGSEDALVDAGAAGMGPEQLWARAGVDCLLAAARCRRRLACARPSPAARRCTLLRLRMPLNAMRRAAAAAA